MMKARAFGRLVVGLATAGVVLVGMLGLARGAEVMPATMETESEVAAAAGEAVTAYLDYHEVPFSFHEWPVTIGPVAFKKEPVLGWSQVSRGALQLGASAGGDIGFAWDRGGRKLYLDQNRNLDLTDDPSGVFPDLPGRRDFFQIFTNVHLPSSPLGGSQPMLVDLKFYYHRGPQCTLQIRSFWQGKVTLHGQEWQVGWLDGQNDLLLRPWAERNRYFRCTAQENTLAACPFNAHVFFGNHGYLVDRGLAAPDAKAKMWMKFVEQNPTLGELRITGDSVHRVVLQSEPPSPSPVPDDDGSYPYLVLVDDPKEVVRVPVGNYRQSSVWLRAGEAEASLEQRPGSGGRPISVSAGKPAVLAAGGPLTNSVSVSSEGSKLVLTYQLLGHGGAYRLGKRDTKHPPEFAVYQGNKKIAVGKFEFG